jgi:dTDP-4-dehydrorhamnose reductase
MKIKTLILGANGMAGHIITIGLREDYQNFDVISVSRNSSIIKPNILMDVSNFSKLEAVYKTYLPNVIINCVGILNKNAENNPDEAILINSYLPHFLEKITKNTSSKVIHISTDCVFSGKEGNYIETSLKNGQGYYAQSKALGEILNKKDLTLRTSIIGPEIKSDGIGLFDWFINQKTDVVGFSNAIWTGVTTIELLKAIKISIVENISGLFHLVNNTKINKFELLNIINKEFNKKVTIIPDYKYQIDKSLINTRTDFNFKVNDYDQMIREMKLWIENHKDLYKNYQSLF